MARPKSGQPPKATLAFRLTKEEKDMITETAKREHLPVTRLIVKAVELVAKHGLTR